jgi:hypothetical protein
MMKPCALLIALATHAVPPRQGGRSGFLQQIQGGQQIPSQVNLLASLNLLDLFWRHRECPHSIQ